MRNLKTLTLGLILITGIATAQNYLLKSNVIDEGGKEAASASYKCKMSLGQPMASNELSSLNYRAIIGFWHLPYASPPSGIEEQDFEKELSFPIIFSLSQNHPNPFNHQTKIRYALPVETEVSLKVFNTTGRVIRTLVNGKQKAGFYNVTWDIKGVSQSKLPNGIYFYRLEAGGYTSTKKMVKME